MNIDPGHRRIERILSGVLLAGVGALALNFAETYSAVHHQTDYLMDCYKQADHPTLQRCLDKAVEQNPLVAGH